MENSVQSYDLAGRTYGAALLDIVLAPSSDGGHSSLRNVAPA
jgi:hypothetical protein